MDVLVRLLPDMFRSCNISLQQPANVLTAAAIVGQDTIVWAQSSNFPRFNVLEIEVIMKDFEVPGSLGPTGFCLGGIKYMVIKGENGAVIRGCRCRKGQQDPWGGITIKKTNQALVIGIYGDPLVPGPCNKIVERMGDYLIDQGL